MIKLHLPRSGGRQLGVNWVGNFLGLAVLCLVVIGAAANAQLAPRLEQASNGTPEAPISAVEWVNTTITAQRGHYVEASSIPYRLVFDTILPGPHRVVIAWDTKADGRHATDYLTYFGRLQPHNQFGAHNVPETIQPLRNVSGGPPGPTVFPIPGPSQPPASLQGLPPGQRAFHIYGGTITGATYVAEGSLANASAESRVAIDFTANDAPVVILFGGHIAAKEERGVGQTAGGVSTLDYRMRVVEVDGLPVVASVAVNALAVVSPPTCNISGPDPVCPGTTNTYSVTTDAAGATFTWTLTANTAGALIVGPNTGPSVQVRSGNGGGSFTLQVAIAGGPLQTVCGRVVTVWTNASTSPLANVTVCPGGTAVFSITPSGTGPFTFLWRKGDTVLPGETNSQLVLTNVQPAQGGLYCADVIGRCNTATSCATLGIYSNTTATALANLSRCVGDGAVFTTTASGAGPFTYHWRKNGVEISGQTNRILSIPSLVPTDAGTYAVEVSGLCNSVTNSGQLTIYALPPCGIQGPGTICPQSSGNVFSAPTGMAEYRWRVTGNGGIVGPTNQQNVVVVAGLPGFVTVNLTTVNSNGCSRACSRTITVGDIQPPVVTCPENIQTNTEPGQCSRTVQFAVSANDNCDGVTVTCNPPSGTKFQKGTTTVNCTASDGSGNVAGCSFNVSVVDLEKPILSCPTNVTVNNDPGRCEAAATYVVTAADNCPGTTVTCSPPSGTVFPLGTSSVTCRGSDAAGNIEFCTFDVTVVDREGPQITCPPDLLFVTEPKQCDVLVDYVVEATDNCAMSKLVCVPPSGSIFSLGVTTVNCVATDMNQNQGRCSFDVQVDDGEDPRIVCPPNAIVPCEPGRCDAVVGFPMKMSDNCHDITLTCVPPSGTHFPVGQTNVNCTATDTSGNSASCTFKVTVFDNERPVLTCPAHMVVNAATGRCDAVVNYTPIVTDNCPGARVDCTPPSGSVFATGLTVVNCFASDASSNVVSCAFNVTVQDAEPPQLVCPGPINLNTSPGECTALLEYDLFEADNCSGVEVFCDVPSGSAVPVGAMWVYCLVLDRSGNTAECMFPVTVMDIERPVISCPADIVLNTRPGRCDAIATFAPTASDNCDMYPVTCMPPSGSAFPKGTNVVNCTALDVSGNAAACAFRVIVQDREAPALVCPPNIVTNNTAGRCDATVTFAPTPSDNCPGVTVICLPPSGTAFVVGQTVVACVATDASGNTNRCTFLVTVNDLERPVVTCPADIVAATELNRCDAVVNFTANASDNCPGVTVACTPPSGSRFSRGTNVVTCTATDAGGNTAGCSFKVTVNDTQAPVITCPANLVTNTAPGRCDAVVSFAPSASDNCSGVTVVCTPATGSVFPKGTNAVSCTATDASGNTNRCSFTVTVQDREAPFLVCPANIVTNSETGRCDAAVTFAPSTSDNCPGTSVICSPASGIRFVVGQTVVTCTATDASGNTNRCIFTVTVQDHEAPSLACPANITTNSAASRCDALVTFAATATDNCSGATVLCSPPSGTRFFVGQTTVTCVATDASANTNRCTFLVTVNDLEPPVVTCPANIATVTETNRCDAVANFNANASDNCAGVTVVCAPPSGSRFARGTNIVTCTATDAGGNTAGCSFSVIVNDNQAPVITCPANVVTNTTVGRCDAVVSFAASATDNCTATTVACTPASGSVFPKGTNVVNCTATDASGNTNRCSFTVTVQDREAPSLVCPTNISTNSAPGRCDATVTFATTATDNCPGTTVICTPPSGSAFVVGQTVVTCVATDASGNTNRCTFSVTVNDTERPAINCPADIVTVTESNRCDALVTFTPNATDNCPGLTVVCSPSSGSRFLRGSTLVTCTATDASANTAGCSFNVTVNDNQAPVVTCPANIVTNTTASRCDAVVSFTPTATDNCSSATVVCVPVSGATFAKGVTTVNCTATDASGNTNRCSFTVTVQDHEAPSLVCPPNISTNSAPDRCDAVITFAPTFSDNCPGTTVVCTPPSGSAFVVGQTLVACLATDASGNTNRCTFSVTVNDTERPVVNCPANIVTVAEPNRCDAVVNFTANASDNCAGVTVVCAPPSGSRFVRGTNVVTCTATDAGGNTAGCSFNVVVNDNQAPVISCPPNIVTNTTAGRCDAVVSFAASASDNCTATTVVCTPVSGSLFPKGTNVVNCTATDASGNTNRCSFTVTVQDREAPSLVCPPNISTNSAVGRCDAVAIFAPTVSDNCPGTTVVCTPPSGSAFVVGQTVVACVATDASGNTNRCTFSVTVNDLERPEVICPADIVTVTESNRCDAVVNFTPNAFDNCPGVTVVCVPPSGSRFVRGSTVVACTATDASTNAAACAFTVIVNDTQPPVAICPASIVTNTATGRCDAVVSYAAGVTDNCPGATIVCTPPSGATFAGGVTPVNCVATDVSGNTNRCSFTVTVQDHEKPVITCPPAQELFTGGGRCDAVATFAATATDNCSGVNITCVPPSGSRFTLGTNTVTCTATDASSNVATCSFTVTVRDIDPPVLTCPTNIVVATDAGRCDAIVNFAATAVDDCPGATVVCVPPTGTRFVRGTTPVNCTATDASSNRVTCSFSVKVEDRENPRLICSTNILTNTAPARCDRIVEFATSVTDNCGAEVLCVPTSGSTFALGTNVVTCTATDAAGNRDTCAFSIVVLDTEKPIVTCPTDINVNTEPGRCDAIATFAPNATDNCALATLACVPPSGTRFNKGVNTVICTATDASGNTATCSFRVTVSDHELPAITCPQSLVLNTDPGLCSARATFSAQVNDNCPGAIVQCTPPSGSDFPIGITTVVCHAIDASGNTRSCAFDVRVTDAEPPRLNCPGDLIVDTEPTQCTATVLYAVTASDACGLTNLVCAPPSGSLFSKGVTPVQCSARDASGNEATCAFDVTVRDREAPTMLCPTNVVVSASAGRCDALVDYEASASDNCGSVNILCTPPSGSTFALGTTPVNCRATDDAGNTNQCAFTVRVVDSQRPVLTCPTNMIVSCESNRCDAAVSFAVSVVDNCGAMSMQCTPSSGSRFNLGVTPVTCSSVDAAGNVGTCSFTVTVRDTQGPLIQCPTNIFAAALAGRCDAPVTFNVTATDNCGPAGVSCFPPSGSYFPVGTSTVNCSAMDGNLNLATCDFSVTVRDMESPALQCPADMLVNTATGRCDAVVTFAPQVSDNCSSVSFTCAPPSGTTFLKGTNFVTCTAHDLSSNSVNCTFRVIVRDVEKPQIVCPSDIVVSAESSQCRARVTFSPTATDNCPGTTVVCTPASNSFFNKGVTTVLCVATDTSGNTNRCSFSITVNDTMPPNITCPANIVTNATPGQRSRVVQFAPVVSDNCSGVSYICTPQSGSVFQEGTTPVTCTATDTSGNMRSCSFTVTVSDTEPPVINCPTNLIVSTSAGRCDAPVAFNVTATDNSQTVTVVCVPPSGSVFLKGVTDVLCTATDAVSNQVSCGFTVTVVDLEPPVIACPTNMVLYTDPGRCDTRLTYTTNVTDNCGSASLTCTPPSGTLLPKGTNTVTCNASDTSGNTQLCAFIVRVVDNERPVITCPGKMVFTAPLGQCSAVVNFSAGVTDNCPGASVSCTPQSGTEFAKGTTTVHCTARDAGTNTATCSFQVEVRDLESPVITCPQDIVAIASPGLCGAPVLFSTTVRENCPGAAITCTPPSGAVMPVGTNLVNCTATDTSSNFSTCNFRIIVRDTERPTLSCPQDITIDSTNGACSPVATYSPTVQDNCPGATVFCAPPSGSTFPQGTTRVQCTAVDLAGNMNTCSFSVINRLQPFTASPIQSQIHCAGESATFATAATGPGMLTFTWFKDGFVMPGRTNPSLTFSNLTAGDSGNYAVVVQSTCGSITNSATLTVRSLVAVNGMTNVTKCDCDPLVLSPVVSGTGPFTYTWRKNGSVLPGANGSTLAFDKLGTNDAGLYSVEVSGACNTASASASVGVIHVPNPAIYTNSGAITIYDNAAAFPYPSSVRVTCVPQTIKRATVTLRGFTHSYPDDVDVLLTTPDGRCVMLMSDAGSGNFANNINITLDDSAATALPDSTQLFTGTFRPGNYDTDSDSFPIPAPKAPPSATLSALAGTDANGFWSLFVVDDFQLDSGVINNGWVLRLYWESSPIQITAPRMLPNGGFQMIVTGDVQSGCTIEASSDLINWTPVGPVTPSGQGVYFIDPNPASRRFYRAVLR